MASTPSPAPPSPPPPQRRPIPRLWLWLGLAFLAGIVLFAIAMSRGRDKSFFHAGDVPPSTAEPEYAPLPAPMAGEDGSGIGSLEPPPEVIDEPRPAAPVAAAPREAPPVEHAPPPPAPRPSVADRKARPIPGQTPPPEYPTRALRNGDGGTVLVMVHIGPDGVPTSTEIAQSSGSRELDRAAMQAVRNWRFEPEIHDGHPTVGEAVVPIDFRLSN
ncbi:energy transducer TonB [Lysobacter xanthus]